MEKYLTWYKEIIKRNGIKNTKQKEAVLNVLIKAPSHLTVEEIYQQIKDVKIGLATVYRSLKLFGKKPLHIHFKCTNCNAMTDIDDTETNLDYIRLNQKVEHKMGLEVNDANITLLGLCKECRENPNVNVKKLL